MYCGFNKEGGGIIGEIKRESLGDSADWAEVADSTSAEEAVVVFIQDEVDNGGLSGEKVILTSNLNSLSGDLFWSTSQNQTSITKRTLGMSQVCVNTANELYLYHLR